MDKRYIELFKDLAKSTALSAEQVMDYDAEKDDKTGYETAQIMRDNYEDLNTRITEAQDDYVLNKTDAAKLTVAALILVGQLQDRVTAMQKAITSYQADLIPKLQEIVDNSKDDEEAIKMANEKFVIENNE